MAFGGTALALGFALAVPAVSAGKPAPGASTGGQEVPTATPTPGAAPDPPREAGPVGRPTAPAPVREAGPVRRLHRPGARDRARRLRRGVRRRRGARGLAPARARRQGHA